MHAPTQTPPPDAALPGKPDEVEGILDWMTRSTNTSGEIECGNILRTHIAALTAQNAALVADAERLERSLAGWMRSANRAKQETAALVAERDALLKSIEHLSSDEIPDRAFVPGEPCFVCGDPLTGFATCDGNPGHTTGLTWATFRRVHAAREDLADKRNARIMELVAERDALRGAAVRIYNSGYTAGHHDTVEAGYVDIHWSDMDTYHADEVNELLARLKSQGEAPSDE